jgi:RimJ/RimL family protein N-acetyltransferase
MKYMLENEETERLKFRRILDTDFEEWTKLFDHPDSIRFLGMQDLKTPQEMTQKWFDKMASRLQNDEGGLNVLIDKSTGRLVGQCGLLMQELDGEQRLEVGYAILPEFWGKGYASEASQKCRDYCFQNDFWPDLISIIHIENVGSQRVAKKNGMKIEKSLDDYKGMPIDVFSITKKAWVQR